ncbi:dermonecrotic toxin domain-containing protein [Pseudomonas psychrophila]|uniref:dermonecrotic toxin domain-containing protein n=1 Tax=Pseudomonas psychrophila TaxID=122355 RepID=UPI0003605280|nr:DUF6543 domain-containing protein [Pseudomonas psychrophila]
MNATALAFYVAQALHDTYIKRLSQAQSAGVITGEEQRRLLTVLEPDRRRAELHVYHPLLSRQQGRSVPCVGALIVGQNQQLDGVVYVFTLWGMFERYPTQRDLRFALQTQMDDPALNNEWLRFCPVQWRPLLTEAGLLTLSLSEVSTPVMASASQALENFLRVCQEQVLERLSNLTTLRSDIDIYLMTAMLRELPGPQVPVANIQVRSTRLGQHPLREGDVMTSSLSATAMDYFLKGRFPAQYSREYLGVSSEAVALPASELEQCFTRVMANATENLPERLQASLQSQWLVLPFAQLELQGYCATRQRDIFFHDMLQARHDEQITQQQFSQLQQVLWGTNSDNQMKATRLAVFDPYRGPVDLCGLFCLFLPGQNAPVFLFGGAEGLVQYETRARLKSAVLSALRSPTAYGFIARHAPLDQHELLAGMLELRLSVELIDTNPFDDVLQSIAKKQISDFGFLLRQFKAGRIGLAAVDHALDVRELVDRNLLTLSNQSRWSTRFVPTDHGLTLSPRSSADQADLLSLKLPQIDAQLKSLLRQWPTVRTFAAARLHSVLVASGQVQLDASRLRVQVFDREPQPELAPVRTLTLVDALLERVTGYLPLPLNLALTQVAVQSLSNDELKPLRSLAGTKLLNVLEQAARSFEQQLEQHQRAFFFAPFSSLNPSALVDRLSTLRMVMLRAELRLIRLEGRLQTADREVLNRVLDYPVGEQRPALDQFVPDVFGVIVSFDAGISSLDIANCLLITQRGGLESANAGRAIFWSPAMGFESFASLDECKTQLEARIISKVLRWDVLAQTKAGDQAPISLYLDGGGQRKPGGQNGWLYFERLEQDFTRLSQSTVLNMGLADALTLCRTAKRIPLSAQGFENSFRSALLVREAGVNLARVIEMAHLQLFNASLPDWLRSASPAEQMTYAHVLQRYQQAAQPQHNYLHDIPEMAVYANAVLTARLDLDYPGQGLDPDLIEIVVDTYLAAPVPVGSVPSFIPAAATHSVQSLSEFVLNGLHLLNEGVMFVRLRDNGSLPVALNAVYVRRLTRELDLGQHYRTLLETKLAPGKEGVALRQQQFAEQLAVQVIEQALKEKLQNPGFETAYHCLCHVMDMPDGTAREALNGVTVIARPFQLIAEPGVDPDPVQGVYIIGPADPLAGPQIMWINYSKRFTFKSYANEAALLGALHTDAQLGVEILQRIAPYDRKTYDRGGFAEPHLARYVDASLNWFLLKPAPPTLAQSPIMGNLFIEMYKDNYKSLLDMAAAQAESTAQADWESFKYLMSLIITSALMLLPGRLSIPLAVWQSLGWLRQGVEAAKRGEWGESVTEFATMLILIASGAGALRPASSIKLLAPPVVESGIRVRLTPEQSAGLQPFQAHEVNLQDLHKEPGTQLHRDPRSGLRYVHLAGRLFSVEPWRERWRIYIGAEREGPLVKLNGQNVWELDLKEPLPGGGPLLSATAALGGRISHDIQATGMESIQRHFPEKALIIREAHAHALSYLQRCQNALHTLNEPSAESVGHRHLLQTFFEVSSINQPLLDRLNQTVEPMLTRFLHPDLSPHTSNKYLVCRSRFNDKSIAWIHRWDSQHRIYLSDRFFNTLFESPEALSQPFIKPTVPPFPVNAHYRSSFLLHEISHLVLNTEDINYLNPGFPYDDLLDENTAFGERLKSFNQIVQECHSPHILQDNLFQQLDPVDLTWSDIASGPGKARIKQIAGVQTLEQARPIFVNNPEKRIEMMLANADTVALLITQLGREHPVVPAVPDKP